MMAGLLLMPAFRVLSESYFFATASVVKVAVVEYVAAVAEGMFHLPPERMSRKRTPAAFALDNVVGDCPRIALAHYCEVGLIAFAYESASVDVEKQSRTVAHQFGNTFYGEHSFVYQFEHGQQRELYHRHA